MSIFDVDGYLVESAMNKIFYRKYSVGKVLLTGVGQVYKSQKSGPLAIVLDIFWIIRYIWFLGPREFIYQLRFAKRLPFLNP